MVNLKTKSYENFIILKGICCFRYNKTLEVCQLKRDLAFMPYGDKTIVGDRGIRLSGGQSARINLARAVYLEADIYLFDDPLSAVDAEVGRKIFEDCFSNFLKNKTVILVTHQIQYLYQADRILVLENGKLLADENMENLKNSNIDLIRNLGSEEIFDDLIAVNKEENFDDLTCPDDEENLEETRTRGKISAGVYLGYFRAVRSWPLVIFVVLIEFFSVVCTI